MYGIRVNCIAPGTLLEYAVILMPWRNGASKPFACSNEAGTNPSVRQVKVVRQTVSLWVEAVSCPGQALALSQARLCRPPCRCWTFLV